MRFPFWRRRREEELDEEIKSHLREAAQDRLQRGESVEQAEATAHREFGNVGLIKEVSREVWGFRTIEILLQDLRYAMRMLIKYPAFTAIVVLSLALGIGANTAIFSVVNALLFKPLPYQQPERLMAIEHRITTGHSTSHDWTYPAFIRLRAENKSFEQTATYLEWSSTLTFQDEPEKEQGEIVSANYFPMFRINALIGRTFLPEEDVTPNAYPVILLSQSLWLRRCGGDSSVIGKTIYLDKNPFTVIGVLPYGFRGQSGIVDFWIPVMMAGTVVNPRILTSSNFFSVIARLKPDVSFDQAKAELSVMEPKFAHDWSTIPFSAQTTSRSKLVPLRDTKIDPAVARAFLVLLAAVGCVLLIACANTANLLLARSIARQSEFAVRLALGAGRNRIIRQVLTESLLLAVIGGIAGLLVAVWGVAWLTANKPWNRTASWTPYAVTFEYFSVKIDWRVLAFNFGVAMVTGVFFGLFPAWQSSRFHLNEVLKEGIGSSVRGFRTFRHISARSVLIVAEIALSVVLLVGAGLMIKSMSQLSAIKLGFVPGNVITMTVGSDGLSNDFYNSLLERVKALPGIQDVSLANATPLSSGLAGFAIKDGQIEGGSVSEIDRGVVRWNTITSDYFATFHIANLKGRSFSDQDRVGTKRVAVISRAMANAYWPGKDPIGRRLKAPDPAQYDNAEDWIEVIGIVDDVKYASVEEAYQPVCYLPFSQPIAYQMPEALSFKTNTDSASIVATVRREVKKLNKNAPIYDITTMQERTSQATSRYRYSALLLALFAGLASLLAAIGLYGVIGYAVSARTRELGIRIALGALPRQILKMIVIDGVVLILAGLTLGMAGAYAVTRVLINQLYQVKPTDSATFFGVGMILVAVALLACYVPARRASKVDPMTALRYE